LIEKEMTPNYIGHQQFYWRGCLKYDLTLYIDVKQLSLIVLIGKLGRTTEMFSSLILKL